MPIPDFEQLEAKLFAVTTDWLGDVIRVKVPPGDFTSRKGFILFDGEPMTGAGFLDPIKRTKRVKLPKAFFESEPDRTVRFQSTKLGIGSFQIAGEVEVDGCDYVFDVQQAGD